MTIVSLDESLYIVRSGGGGKETQVSLPSKGGDFRDNNRVN